MTAPATREEFLLLLRQSGLLESRRLERHLEKAASQPHPADANSAAGELVRGGLLSEYQAKQLLLGRTEGFQLGKYQILDRLGTGTMSTVYLCRHPAMDRLVAIKHLSRGRAANPALLKRFQREARAAAVLDHPNIVHAFDFEEDEQGQYLIMEYVEGCSLRALVEREGPLSPRKAAELLRQAARGLQHAHEANLVHRDVKPGNLLVAREGTVKLLDMGLALMVQDDEEVLTQAVLGSIDYLAPEQTLDSHQVDARADIYGLGATLYFMLAGKPPFPEGTVSQKLCAHRTQQPRALREVRSDVPPSLEAILAKMMAKNPRERYQSATEVMEALTTFLAQPVAAAPVMAKAAAPCRAEARVATPGGQALDQTPRPRPSPARVPVRAESASAGSKVASRASTNAGKVDLAATPLPPPRPSRVPPPVKPLPAARVPAPPRALGASEPYSPSQRRERRTGITWRLLTGAGFLLALAIGVALGFLASGLRF